MKRNDDVTAVGVRAVDVGYFNVKYTRGRKRVGDSNVIDVGLFPALAPQLAGVALAAAGGSAVADACAVSVGGVRYAVGPAAVFHTSGSEPRPVDPDYCASDKYHALTLGALHYMAQHAGATEDFVIELLVLGLPLNNYARHAARLAQRMRDTHVVGDEAGVSRRVTVQRVHVMVQPHGALCHFGAVRSNLEGWTLVVDPGGGTLDWFMAHGQQPNWKRSGAYPKAMLQCAYAVADCIDARWRHQYEVVEAIDRALRSGAASLRVGAREWPLQPYWPAVEAVLQESLKAMLESTGPLDAVRRVLLTGGGAGLYRAYLARTMPELEPALEIDEDPIFSNVRGFHACGEVLLGERHGG
ncbi:MAG TPA: hypothetical protein VHL79_24445 [Ramlibacter sp.]|jgi:plasmid segregation protein ParM|nr:hypothetical protein [Ramlibacter sp.]